MLALLWAGFFVAGDRLAALLASKFAAPLGRMAKGKIADPTAFVYHRLWDGLWLGTLPILLIAVFLAFRNRAWVTKIVGRQRWVFQSLLLFVLLNLWVGIAMQRPLFWALLYCGEGTSNFTQFKLKKTLTFEAPPVPRAILLGNSQTRAQIDENLLNQELTNQLWTTELHFPGSAAFDVALVSRHLRRVEADFLIVYVSEGLFFSGRRFTTLPYFVSFSDIAWLRQLGAVDPFKERDLYVGLLGDTLPLFRARESLAQRLLGKNFTGIQQARFDQGLEMDLAKRAQEVATGFKSDHSTEFQKRAFEEFLREAAAHRSRVILLVGQLNPVLGECLDPTLRPDMLQFLRAMAAKYNHVVLVEGPPFLGNVANDYVDLSHVSPQAQERFTIAFANFLRSQFLKADNVKK
jgi:hypothetical protein